MSIPWHPIPIISFQWVIIKYIDLNQFYMRYLMLLSRLLTQVIYTNCIIYLSKRYLEVKNDKIQIKSCEFRKNNNPQKN